MYCQSESRKNFELCYFPKMSDDNLIILAQNFQYHHCHPFASSALRSLPESRRCERYIAAMS